MASVISHPAVALGAWMALGPKTVGPRLLVAAAVATVLPDVDAFGFWAGVPCDHLLGHRGLTHSFFFALSLGAAAALGTGCLRASRRVAFALVAACAASHGILDAMTTGGPGIAFLSPFSNERFFLPWRVIPVSPIGVRGFQTWLPAILGREILQIWVPCLAIGACGILVRRYAAAEQTLAKKK